jgi:hypothetical protein
LAPGRFGQLVGERRLARSGPAIDTHPERTAGGKVGKTPEHYLGDVVALSPSRRWYGS